MGTEGELYNFAPRENNETSIIKKEEESGDTECGIASFRPSFLQVFANVNAFVGVYSFLGLISQALSVYVNSQVPSLEKQFGLSSVESGLVMGFNDIGFFTFVLLASSVVRFVHIPRFIYGCMVLYGLSGVLCSLPYFITQLTFLLDNENFGESESNASKVTTSMLSILCDPSRNVSKRNDDANCSGAEEKSLSQLISTSLPYKNTALVLIGIGMVLQGIGKAPRSAAFTVYVDDNVDRRKTGCLAGKSFVFFGIFVFF